MKQFLSWQVAKSADGKNFDGYIPATVPGNVQLDYAKAHGFADDWYVADNFRKFDGLEDHFWKYRAVLPAFPKDEIPYFVAEGIDYRFDILLDGIVVDTHEGMFTTTRLPLTNAHEGSVLEVLIYPAPKHPILNGDQLDESRIPLSRSEADRSAKPAVCYGWDFHPRLIVQGIWEDAYVETVKMAHILASEIDYEIADIRDDKGTARLRFSCRATEGTPEFRLLDGAGNLLLSTQDTEAETEVSLWYPHNVGAQPLYVFETVLKNANGETQDVRSEKIGFRKIELLMNEGAWWYPLEYPMTRSFCPFTICINGKKVFGKGSNFVNPEVFVGTLTEENYRAQLTLVKECNMNILRLWGGAIVNKQAFFDVCDELGIMVWQEFPLACNNYVDDKHYLQIIAQEGEAIVRKIKNHPCHIIWCGGNELFNSWSRMTDQSLVLRTLNKLCLELDPQTPFLPTSPVMGVTHGPYRFSMHDRDVFHLFNDSISTGYTEFGFPSTANYEELKKFIPADELDRFANTKSWRAHCAFEAEDRPSGHCDVESVEKYFGKITDTKAYVACSQFLACAGYTYVFEEARRQQPLCSMAINWCFNEPWYCAANNSLLSYGNAKKPAYDAVKQALSAITPSLRMKKFEYRKGERAAFEVHLLNDSGKNSGVDSIDVYLDYGKKKKLTTLYGTASDKNEYFGEIGFVVDDELLNASGYTDLPGNNVPVAVVLKAGEVEKRYPLMIMKN